MRRRRHSTTKPPIVSSLVASLADRYRSGELVLLDILHRLHDRRGFISRSDLRALSYRARIPLATLQGTASFYSNFRLEGPPPRSAVKVCTSLPCHLNGSVALLAALRKQSTLEGSQVAVTDCSCLGICERAPAVTINGMPVGTATEESVLSAILELRTSRRRRRVPPRIDYTSLARYRREGGYDVLERVRRGELDPSQVVSTLKDSGLRGMGGAGFPAGQKWEFVLREPAQPKYVVCNADEGEPGTFKDRAFLELSPHEVLEGLLIAAATIEAKEAVLYVREEYLTARANLQKAIGELGKDGIAGPREPRLRVVVGAGAYVCGEETALLESIEGKRGEPRLRPPYPATFGLWGKPTLIHNVETLARVPQILRRGAEWFRGLGRNGAAGIKRYAISGNVRKPGWLDAPLGLPAEELVREHAGGMRDGHALKALFPGGVASGFLGPRQLATPLDFEPLARAGTMLGSGGVIAIDETVCAVDMAENCLEFFARESCGKCTPCRAGSEKLFQMVRALRVGKASLDSEAVDELAATMVETSICGLGMTAPVALRHALQHFPEEFDAHARGRCLTGWCAR